MPEQLNLKQISDKLNAELVFWYDDKAEFTEDAESLEVMAKI